jgi:tRNA(Ile)-lysidine synthetase-like protein
VAEVARRLTGRCGVTPGAKVVVGVSGGPDSLALLLAAVVLRRRRRGGTRGLPAAPALEPVAVHVNHHLRDSAEDDAAFVTDLCDRFGVPWHLRDVYPRREPGNLAANARRLRYDALADAAASVGAAYVAAAHHGEDQLETLLIALCRGAGLEGLSGMAWSRPLGGVVRLIRPLLAVRKSACEELCGAAGVEWREDPANLDPAAVRARLRRDVLPVLEALWPDAASRAARAADVVAAARAALEKELDRTFGDPTRRQWKRKGLAKMPAPIIAAGLRRAAVDAVPEAADDIGQAHLLPVAEVVRGPQRRPHQFDWPHGLHVVVTAVEVKLFEQGSAISHQGESH